MSEAHYGVIWRQLFILYLKLLILSQMYQIKQVLVLLSLRNYAEMVIL